MKLNVKGMRCASCAGLITETVMALGGRDVTVDIVAGTVAAQGITAAAAKKAIADIGYTVTP